LYQDVAVEFDGVDVDWLIEKSRYAIDYLPPFHMNDLSMASKSFL
jgi:hypothetical protein